jgi:cytoskeletal protein CcmA (bactofilin family)
MQKNIFLSLIVCGVFFLLPSYSHAGPIIRTGETVSVDSTQTLKGDFYGFGSKVVLSGGAENDAYLAGGTITLNAPVQEDLTALGGVVGVYGDVGDDVRVVGGDVTIAKAVKGDVAVLGNRLTILSTGSVEGDVLFMGEELVIEGKVIGSIHGNANTARINAEIGGDVLLTTQTLFTIGSNAKIQGLVSYKSAQDVVRAQDAVIVGEVQKIPSDLDFSNGGIESMKSYVLQILVLIFATLSLFMLARRQVTTLAEASQSRFGFYGLVGLAMILTIPFISVVLFVSILGSFLGFLLTLSFFCILGIAVVLSPLVLGQNIERIIWKGCGVSPRSVGVGFILLALLWFVPYSIFIVLTVYSIVIVGAIGSLAYTALRSE